MAQTQTLPDELRQPKAQTKKLRSRSQSSKGRGGIAKKEETAKATSNSSPNYMKPTTCSDARKEPMQVSAQSPASATVVKAKNHADQSNSKPSPSPSLPVAKYLKTLARKASLRPRRPSMKKIYETSVLSPRRKVSRATCSSTMKESKFPNASEVNPPGNKAAELTSAVKVCPFNYCSLHGRRHRHLQPLRRLPSARLRRSFRTQRRSVKLKKGGRSMNSSKTRSIQGSKIAPCNEIYKDEFDREISKKIQSLEPSEIEEFEGAVVVSGIAEQHGFVAENGGEDDRIEGCNAEEWPENKELEITSGYDQNPDSSLKLTEYQGFWDSNFIDLNEDIYSEDDQTSEHDETEQYKDVSDGDILADICTRNGMITSSEAAARCKQSPKLSNKQKARRRSSVKWKKDIEMEVLRLINPRAPRFLPAVESDPADETVDLRHQQQRDERKSSETWMIDNALQKAVRKLTPARSKKVALLVEAFETVMSVPIDP